MLGVKGRWWEEGNRERRQRAGKGEGKERLGMEKGERGPPWLLRIAIFFFFFAPLCINLLSNSRIALSDGNKSVIITNVGPLMSLYSRCILRGSPISSNKQRRDRVERERDEAQTCHAALACKLLSFQINLVWTSLKWLSLLLEWTRNAAEQNPKRLLRNYHLEGLSLYWRVKNWLLHMICALLVIVKH